MNGCPIDDELLQQLVAQLEATPPRPHHSPILALAGRAFPGQPFRHALSRGGWYRPGGVVRADGERVADSLDAWLEAELADCDDDMDALCERHGRAGLLATRHSGRTHYFVAPYGATPSDFLQLEIEELHEVLDRRLFPEDAAPVDLQELIDPLHPATLEAHPVGLPRYRFRRLTDMRYVTARLPVTVGQPHPLARLFGEWMSSQPRGRKHFCDHWIVTLREHQDRFRNPVLSATPVSLHARQLKPFQWNRQARGADMGNQLHAFDRTAGYPGAWYFHLAAGGLVPRDIAAHVVADLDDNYSYIREQEARLIRDWVREPYSV